MLDAQTIEALIKQWIPMAEDFGLRVDAVSSGQSTVRVPANNKLIRPGGTLSGPVMMTAADVAMYVAILGTLGEVAMAVTSNLNINFLHRPEPVDLIAEAHIIKLGSRLAFCEVELRSLGSEDLVAHATGSYALPMDIDQSTR